MNLIFVDQPAPPASSFDCILPERAHQHLQRIIRPKTGDTLRVAILNGNIGTATVLQTSATQTQVHVELTTPPPVKQPITLVLALPRPKMLRRILSAAVELGVEHIHVIHSYRVEKSFWQSPYLRDDAIASTILSALEQSVDTKAPHLEWHRAFKPFAQDRLPTLAQARSRAWLADHRSDLSLDACAPGDSALLCIGPEGGFIDYEIDLLEHAGLQKVQLGPRTLRVETAVSALLGKLI